MLHKKITIVVLLVIKSIFAADNTVLDKTGYTLGIEYDGLITGQTITNAKVKSEARAHYCMFRYAPVSNILISVGIGGTKFKTESYKAAKFDGNPGLSGAAGLQLYTPLFFKMLKITGGAESFLLNSSCSDYHYTAAMLFPHAGVQLSLGEAVDLQLGYKGHIFLGSMSGPDGNEYDFSNNNYNRGYISAKLHSFAGAYVAAEFDVSPMSSPNWSKGPEEAALSIQVGYLLKRESSRKKEKTKAQGIEYFKSYDTMKDLQDKMADDITTKK